MSEVQLQPQEKHEKLTKKGFHKAIQEKLAGALADYRHDLGEKRFSTRIKKASKLFSRGVIKAGKKKSEKKQKVTIKKVSSKAAPVKE